MNMILELDDDIVINAKYTEEYDKMMDSIRNAMLDCSYVISSGRYDSEQKIQYLTFGKMKRKK